MGLARVDNPLGAAHEEGLTSSCQVMGTVDYMAPEQAFDSHAATTAADVYSLGCTVYRLLTGKALYEGQTVVEKILAHRDQPIPRLDGEGADIPRAIRIAAQPAALTTGVVLAPPRDCGLGAGAWITSRADCTERRTP